MTSRSRKFSERQRALGGFLQERKVFCKTFVATITLHRFPVPSELIAGKHGPSLSRTMHDKFSKSHPHLQHSTSQLPRHWCQSGSVMRRAPVGKLPGPCFEGFSRMLKRSQLEHALSTLPT